MILQETFLIIINVKNRFAAELFVEIHVFAGFLMNRKFKRTALIAFITLIDSIFHITNVFTATFDQFKVSLHNKSINFFH